MATRGHLHEIELEGSGSCVVRDIEGPSGAPTLLLLHGWGATARMNWGPCFEPLSRHFRVLAVDHRGHGRGLRTTRFDLAECADDAIEIAEALSCDSVIAVGWSMGGPIASLAWRRHPERVGGLVLCATGRHFVPRRVARAAVPAMRGLARLAPSVAVAGLIQRSVARAGEPRTKARFVREYRNHDPAALIDAFDALSAYSAHDWIGEVDIPTACVVTTRDGIVPPERQRRLAAAIPGSTVFEVEGDHSACVAAPERFVPALTSACLDVAGRIGWQALPGQAQAG